MKIMPESEVPSNMFNCLCCVFFIGPSESEWWICPFADVGWCPHPKQGFRHTSGGAPSCGWNGQVFAAIGQKGICGQAIHTHDSSTHIWRWEVAAWEHMLFEQKALVARNARSARSARTLESHLWRHHISNWMLLHVYWDPIWTWKR